MRPPQTDLSPAFDPYLFLPYVCDDGGVDDVPGESDLNCFSWADDLPGWIGVRWSWNATDDWTGTGQTGDACALFDTDDDGDVDFAFCLKITNTPDGGDVAQVAPPESPLIYECGDKRNDRCSQPLAALDFGDSTCEVVKDNTVFPDAGDEAPWDVLGACSLELSEVGVSGANLVNVCSFPSGKPNGGARDCIISPGAGFIRIEKVTLPADVTTEFGFTLDPPSSEGRTEFALSGDGAPALIPLLPSEGPDTLTEVMPSDWEMSSASCFIDDGSETPTGTADISSARITGIAIQPGLVTDCTFANEEILPTITVVKTASQETVVEPAELVTYTITVTNDGQEPVTLIQLLDDLYGDVKVMAGSTCAVPVALNHQGDSYSCTFLATVTGTAGDVHTNVVIATVEDDEGNQVTATDEASVTVTAGAIGSH